MSIKSICTKKVITAKKNASIVDVVNLMQSHHVGSVVVVEQIKGNHMPVGIITDRDISFAMSSVQSKDHIKVEHLMQSVPITINEKQGIYEAIEKMQEFGVKRLPVVDDEGALVGIVSKNDILNLVGQELGMLAKIDSSQIRNEQGMKLPMEPFIESHL